MTVVVTDEMLGRFARQQHDWFGRVRKGSLDPAEVAVAVQRIIDRGTLFASDRCKDGWTLEEDVGFTSIDLAKLELVSFLREGEDYIGAEEMMRRARTELRVNLGQQHAEYLLKHQQEIPKQFRKYDLIFTGTVWHGLEGERRVVAIYWSGEYYEWILYFPPLQGKWEYNDRLVRPHEVA